MHWGIKAARELYALLSPICKYVFRKTRSFTKQVGLSVPEQSYGSGSVIRDRRDYHHSRRAVLYSGDPTADVRNRDPQQTGTSGTN